MTRSLVIVLLLVSATSHARAADPAREQLSAASLARAGKLLAELAKLDATQLASASAADARRAGKLAAQIYGRAQEELPEGDLRTDLSTAARFYERAYARQPSTRAASPTDSECAGERPGAYRRLCATASGREMVTLLLAKGRLHADWARAFVADAEGAGAGVAGTIAEMRSERVLDAVLARQALVALDELEKVTNAPATLADFETERQIGKVSPTDFSRRLDAAARTIRQSLAWLPESALKSDIDNAFESYADALWWWQRAERPLVVNVAGNNFVAHDFAAMSRVPDTQLGYNAVANLRHARAYARHAASLLDAQLSRAGLALAGN
jgi:hypothetical protein